MHYQLHPEFLNNSLAHLHQHTTNHLLMSVMIFQYFVQWME